MEDNENMQVLDVQMRSGKDGYIGIMVGNFSRMAFIIASEKMQPANMYYMANLIISMIPGQDIRQELIQTFKNKIKEIKEEKLKEGYPENVAKDISISAASVFMVGEATDFLNLHLGITKEARVEIDLAPAIEEYLQKIKNLENEIKILKEGKK